MRGVLVVSFACACGGAPATFPCATSAQCVDGARQGVCEPAGFCSFADPTCPSGARFDPSAGGGLANVCLDGGMVAVDTPASTCLDRWMAGTIHFGAATPLAINTTDHVERDPFETYDELTLYFSSNRNGNLDIYSSTRATTTAAYSSVVRELDLSSPGDESKMSITSSGLYATVTSSRGPNVGGTDVWRATRSSPTSTFSMLDENDFGMVNTPNDELDARISADGLHLYLAPRTGTIQNLVVASRAQLGDTFDAPVLIAELSTGMEADPSPSLDERILVFTSLRPAAAMGSNLWYATRASATATFGAPQLVPDLDTDEDEGDPHLSPDGCTLYFARAHVGLNDYDIYEATVQ